MEKRALIHVFVILGTLLISILLWRGFVGTTMTTMDASNQGALFDKLVYTGADAFFDDVVTQVNTEDMDSTGSLRRVMQTEWMSHTGGNGLDTSIICSKLMQDAGYDETDILTMDIADDAVSTDGYTFVWKGSEN